MRSRRLLSVALRGVMGLVYVGALVVMVWSRRPDVLTNPQFYAEDGAVWFSDAYNQGPVASLFGATSGYLLALPRLTADVSLVFKMTAAPLVFNVVAIALQVAPGIFFLSRRFKHLVPSVYVRAGLGALIVAVPNGEVYGNLTNGMWNLAILATMVLLAAPARSLRAKLFDLVVLVSCGLTGPFVIFLVPLAAARLCRHRHRWRGVLLATTATLATVQLAVWLLSMASTRSHAPLGATPANLAMIVVNRVIVPALSGRDALLVHPGTWPYQTILAIPALAAAALLTFWAMRRAGDEVRLFVLFAALVLASALVSPLVSLAQPQWPLLATSGAGDRYFLIPSLGVIVLVAWALSRLRRPVALPIAVALCAIFIAGDVGHWRYTAFVDLHPASNAQRLDAVAPGTTLTFPLNPKGWMMTVTKH